MSKYEIGTYVEPINRPRVKFRKKKKKKKKKKNCVMRTTVLSSDSTKQN